MLNKKIVAKSIAGFIFAPEYDLYGLLKSLFYFCKSPKHYFYSNFFEIDYKYIDKDDRARSLSATIGFARLASITMTTLCIIGFVSTVLLPIPGVAPLYAVSVLGILQAAGITTGWAILARGLGAFIGYFLDSYVLYRPLNPKARTKEDKIEPIEISYCSMMKRLTFPALATCVFGGPELAEHTQKSQIELSSYANKLPDSTVSFIESIRESDDEDSEYAVDLSKKHA